MNKQDVKHRYYKDSYGFLLETSRPWEYPKLDGRGDAVARTVMAAIVYRDDFIGAIYKSFKSFIEGGEWIPVRHPECPRTEDFSRDHTIWFIIFLKYFYPEDIKCILRIPWKISEKHSQLGMWAWTRVMGKNRWWDRLVYWAVTSIVLRVNNRWNRLLRGMAGIHSVYWHNFKGTPWDELNRKEKFARKHSAPGYIMDTQAFMIHCLKDGWFKNRLKKRMLPLVEKSNYLVRTLMQDEFGWIENFPCVDYMQDYTGMDGWRWGRRLDKTTGIDLYPLSGPQPPYNMDLDAMKADFNFE